MNLEAQIKHLNRMRTWPDEWNGYNALAPRVEAIDYASYWITEIAQAFPNLIEPTFVTGDGFGGVCIEWLEGQRYFTVDIDERGAMYLADTQLNVEILPSHEEWLTCLPNDIVCFFAAMLLATFKAESIVVRSMIGEQEVYASKLKKG